MKSIFNALNQINLSDGIQIFAVIVSLLLGLFGIIISKYQIVQSNKQDLFDKRFEMYELLRRIDSLCDNLSLIPSNKDDKIYAVDFIAACMTNSSSLYKITKSFNDEYDTEFQQCFLNTIEWLKSLSDKSKLLFPPKYSKFISKYFDDYANILTEMHKYKSLLNTTKNLSKNFLGSDAELRKEQDRLLNGELEKTIHQDVDKYKRNLQNLHNEYATNIEKIDKYLSLY